MKQVVYLLASEVTGSVTMGTTKFLARITAKENRREQSRKGSSRIWYITDCIWLQLNKDQHSGLHRKDPSWPLMRMEGKRIRSHRAVTMQVNCEDLVYSVSQFHASGHSSFKIVEPWRTASATKRKRTKPLGDFFSHKERNLCIRHHHRGFSSLGSQWKDWPRWQKLCSRVEIKRIAWSELGMSSRPCKARKFLLLTHSGQVRGSPWQVLLTHLSSQLSFRKGVVLSSHRAGLNCFPSSGACSEVPVPSPAQHYSAPLLGAKRSPELSTATSYWSELARQQWTWQASPQFHGAARGNSRNSSSQPGAAFRIMCWEGFSWPKPHLQWWWCLVPV